MNNFSHLKPGICGNCGNTLHINICISVFHLFNINTMTKNIDLWSEKSIKFFLNIPMRTCSVPAVQDSDYILALQHSGVTVVFLSPVTIIFLQFFNRTFCSLCQICFLIQHADIRLCFKNKYQLLNIIQLQYNECNAGFFQYIYTILYKTKSHVKTSLNVEHMCFLHIWRQMWQVKIHIYLVEITFSML